MENEFTDQDVSLLELEVIEPKAKLLFELFDENEAKIFIEGSREDLLNLLACACDKQEIRDLLYNAVALDKLHDEKVGRRNDESLYDKTTL